MLPLVVSISTSIESPVFISFELRLMDICKPSSCVSVPGSAITGVAYRENARQTITVKPSVRFIFDQKLLVFPTSTLSFGLKYKHSRPSITTENARGDCRNVQNSEKVPLETSIFER